MINNLPYALRSKVNFCVSSGVKSKVVSGEIRARTIEEMPHYDIMLENGTILQNISHTQVKLVSKRK